MGQIDNRRTILVNLMKDIITKQLQQISIARLRPPWVHIFRVKHKYECDGVTIPYSGRSLMKPSFANSLNNLPFSTSFASSVYIISEYECK